MSIGENIRRIRKARKLGQTDLVRMLQINGCDMTRECLVKIERCTQHIQATQLQAIKKIWNMFIIVQSAEWSVRTMRLESAQSAEARS